MTEEQWLASNEAVRMLTHIWVNASERKLRLAACAAARRVWHLILEGPFRHALETAERYADGRVSQEEAWAAFQTANASGDLVAACVTQGAPCATLAAWYAAWMTTAAEWAASKDRRRAILPRDPDEPPIYSTPKFGLLGAVISAHNLASWAVGDDPLVLPGGGTTGLRQSNERECAWQAGMMRDLFGNPFRPAVLNPSWLTPDVITLAGHIYQDRAFRHLPEMADALEDAGCADTAILAHCREPGEHVRGCWVVDLLLGRS